MKKLMTILIVSQLFVLAACNSYNANNDRSGDMDNFNTESLEEEPTSAQTSEYKEMSLVDEKVSSTLVNYEQDGKVSGQGGESSIPAHERKLIKNANTSFEVKNYDEANQAIHQLVKSYDAYISSENEYGYSSSQNNDMTIRIKFSEFDKMLEEILALAQFVDSKTIYVNDVTEEFVDIEARLGTKRALEESYMNLLNKATKISDIIEIERELSYVRADIESMEGRLKYLSDQVAYSTISISFYESKEYSPSKEGFFHQIGRALESGWNGFLTFIVGLFYAWPVWVVLGIIGFVTFRLLKRWRAKRSK